MIYHKTTMSLDIDKVAPQINGLSAGLEAGAAERRERLQKALGTVRNIEDVNALSRKIAGSKTSWLVAELTEAPERRYPLPPLPENFTVMAADGSHIDVDRHQVARCCLINIGSVLLGYGTDPKAVLNSLPTLYSGDNDLSIAPPNDRGRSQPVEGVLLGIKRSIDELLELARLAPQLPPGSASLALVDGSLILWGLGGKAYPEFVAEKLLGDYTAGLDALRKAGQDKELALASYISYPRSTDVINALRLHICPHPTANCERECPGSRECDVLSGVRDRDIFFDLLAPGERSALFISPSSVIKEYYGPHGIYFYYLRTGDEIGRVEIPAWVARNAVLLELSHALVTDQCRRGHGYPVALSEAHEQAVITGTDRELFWQMVETSLTEAHLPATTSAKSFSKRTRWI